jgi:hypothetical protein
MRRLLLFLKSVKIHLSICIEGKKQNMLDEDRIERIARNAAMGRGYAVYADYNEDLREEICQERSLEPTDAGFYLFTIKRTLLKRGWRFAKHRPARFYPPHSV